MAQLPQIDVDFEFLRQLRFSWTKISEILGISHSTLYRRLQEEGVTYSDSSDTAIDTLVEQIKQQHPNDGERLMIGHLFSCGISVPRVHLHASIHRVDPINTALRCTVTVCRRVYYAEGVLTVCGILMATIS